MVAKQVLVPFVLAAVTGAPDLGVAQQPYGELPSGLREAMIEATYAVVPAGEGAVWSAPNSAQKMHSTFTVADGVRISGGAGNRGPWTLSLELDSWGRPGALVPVEAAEPVARGRRVEYRRGALTEWYVNSERGLEQGFTIEERPAGEGHLKIVLAIGGGPTAQLEPGCRSALFTDRVTGRVLHYSGLRAWDAGQRDLAASLSVEGERLSIWISEEHASYPIYIDPWIATEEAKLTSKDRVNTDDCGESVAFDRDTAVVGNPTSFASGPGEAYVFVRSGTTWTLQQKLVASDPSVGDSFGASVALSGDTVLVGAYLNDVPAGGNEGSAYVFVRSGTTWSEQQKLMTNEQEESAQFGKSVAVSEDIAVIGAHLSSPSGAAYVFVRSGTTWVERQKLVPSGVGFGAFGHSVAISGNTVLVGALYEDPGGSAYVFLDDGVSWSEQQQLIASDTQENDAFGSAVVLSGDTALVGAPAEDNAGGANAGSAYVFVRTGTTWSEQVKLTASNAEAGDSFGHSVAIAGDTAVIGAPLAGTGGSAYVFERLGTWGEQTELAGHDTELFDGFGEAVAVSDDTVVVGAPNGISGDSEAAGAAYAFRLSWTLAVSYCTPGTSASGCQPLMSASGTPSASASSGFWLQVTGVEGVKDGLFFWGANGRQAIPWKANPGGNGTSFQCVVPPTSRSGLHAGTGTIGACDGSATLDLNALWCPTCPKPQKNPGTGAWVQAQFWYRDPFNTAGKKTSLSDAIEFAVAP